MSQYVQNADPRAQTLGVSRSGDSCDLTMSTSAGAGTAWNPFVFRTITDQWCQKSTMPRRWWVDIAVKRQITSWLRWWLITWEHWERPCCVTCGTKKFASIFHRFRTWWAEGMISCGREMGWYQRSSEDVITFNALLEGCAAAMSHGPDELDVPWFHSVSARLGDAKRTNLGPRFYGQPVNLGLFLRFCTVELLMTSRHTHTHIQTYKHMHTKLYEYREYLCLYIGVCVCVFVFFTFAHAHTRRCSPCAKRWPLSSGSGQLPWGC